MPVAVCDGLTAELGPFFAALSLEATPIASEALEGESAEVQRFNGSQINLFLTLVLSRSKAGHSSTENPTASCFGGIVSFSKFSAKTKLLE